MRLCSVYSSSIFRISATELLSLLWHFVLATHRRHTRRLRIGIENSICVYSSIERFVWWIHAPYVFVVTVFFILEAEHTYPCMCSVHIATCRGLLLNYKTGSGFDDYIYWHLIHTSRDYRLYSAIADVRPLHCGPQVDSSSRYLLLNVTGPPLCDDSHLTLLLSSCYHSGHLPQVPCGTGRLIRECWERNLSISKRTWVPCNWEGIRGWVSSSGWCAQLR
jgi:hypothetical protein